MSIRPVALVGITLLLAAPMFAGDETPAAPLEVPEGATLPVVLKKTINAAKAKPGDVVKFELLSPVLAENSVVIPKSAKLYGRIVFAQPLAGKPYSALAIAVDRAEWKHNTVPLYGHVAGFGKFKYVVNRPAAPGCSSTGSEPPIPRRSSATTQDTSAAPRPSRGYNLGTTQPADLPAELSSCGGNDSTEAESDTSILKHMSMRRTNSLLVPLALVSTRKDIVLKKGSLLIVRNGAPRVSAGDTALLKNVPRERR